MLCLKQHTTPLPFHGAVALLERLLQIGRLGKGRLQLSVLVLGCLHGLLAAPGLPLRGLLRRRHQCLQALHLGLELLLVVGQPAALLVCLGKGLLRLHDLGGLRLEVLHLGLEASLVALQSLLQPAGFIKRLSGFRRLRPRPPLVRVGPKQMVSNHFPQRHSEPSPSECGR